MKFSLALCFCIFFLVSCTTCRIFVYNIPQAGDQHYFPKAWFPPSATPQPLPTRYDPFPDSLHRFFRSHHTLAFMLVRDDTIRLEYYAPHLSPSTAIGLFSITKSVVAGVVAIALQEGYISNLSEKLGTYFPDLSPEYAGISLEDLLDMRSGLQESFLKTTELYYSSHLNRSIRHHRLHPSPEQEYAYSNASTQWLVAVVEKATGMPFEDYFYQKLWQPLYTENPGNWTLDSRRHRTVRGFCGLNLSLRDLARLGWCYLHRGNYFGQQIIPAEWISQTFSPPADLPRTPDHFLYHRQWRIITPGEKFLAKGFLGQYLYLDQKQNTLIIRLGTAETATDWLSLFERLTYPHKASESTGQKFNKSFRPRRFHAWSKNNWHFPENSGQK